LEKDKYLSKLPFLGSMLVFGGAGGTLIDPQSRKKAETRDIIYVDIVKQG